MSLRPYDVPPEVRAVRGCDCGGCTYHLTTCSLMQMPYDETRAAIEDAEARIDAFTAGINAAHGFGDGS